MKAFKRFFTLALAVSLFTSVKAHAMYYCEDIFLKPLNFEVKTIKLEEDLVVSYRRIFFEDSLFKAQKVLGDSQDILLGFAEFGHVYMVSDNARLDGDIMGFRTHYNSSTDLMEAGIVIRIKAPAANKDILNEYADTRGVSCGKTACSALRRAGDIYIGGPRDSYHTPYELSRAIFKYGLHDSKGNPVPYDVYYIGKANLQGALKQIRSNNYQMAKEFAMMGGKIAGGTSALGASLLYLFGFFDEEQK